MTKHSTPATRKFRRAFWMQVTETRITAALGALCIGIFTIGGASGLMTG